MTTHLTSIVNRKRVEVARAMAAFPLERMREKAKAAPKPRNFFKAVVDEFDADHTRIIAEIKQKTPATGAIRGDFDPVRIAQQYHEAGAAAISCATDEPDFGGKLEFIEQVRQAVPLAVMRKDVLVDEYQIWESRAAGADAIVLMADVLSEGEIIDFQILATELGMTTLVAAHEVESLLKVKNHIGFPHSRYSLLGISNRNPQTMSASLSHTFRMLDLLDSQDRRVMVSESGITSPADLRRLRDSGINIALVGEHLLRATDPGLALRELLNT